MLDFRRRSRSTNYLQGKQQYKLFALMVLAVGLMLLISLAADPGRWDWMFAGDKPAAEQGKAPFAPDTRLAARQTDDELGTFISAPEGVPTEAAENPDTFLSGIRTDYLQTVRDDTVFRKVEADAWFHLFQLVNRTGPAELAKASTGKVSFRQLYQQPKEYRGRVVTLEGTVRGVSEKVAPKNTYGIERYYQLAIEPDGEKNQLVITYCLELPKGFPTGERVNEHVSLDGFFYKRWAYAAQDAVRTAPLIIAKTVDWQPAPPPATAEPEMNPLTAVAIAFGLFLLVAIGYALLRSWRTSSVTAEATMERLKPETLAALTAVDEGASEFPTSSTEAAAEE